jgi:hypothetical protein
MLSDNKLCESVFEWVICVWESTGFLPTGTLLWDSPKSPRDSYPWRLISRGSIEVIESTGFSQETTGFLPVEINFTWVN